MRRPAPCVLAAALAALALCHTSCSTNPATGKSQFSLYSQGSEIELGRQADREISRELTLYPDERVQAYVSQLGARLAAESERPDLPWTFRVADDPVVNAFALPGGIIYVTRGLLTHLSSEAQLASVLGHEIGHVTGRHSVSRISTQQLAGLGLGIGALIRPEYGGLAEAAGVGLNLLFLKYGRDDERQADDLGLRYLVREGYDAREMPEVFAVLRRVGEREGSGRIPAWLSTHPAPQERFDRIAAEVAKLPAGSSARVERNAYLERLDGMPYGTDPRQGYFVGSRFIHPELGFEIRFPEGWRTANQKTSVAAQPSSGDAAVSLSLASQGSARQAAEAFFSQQGLTAGNVAADRLGGLPAYGGNFSAATQQGTLAGVAAFVEHGGRVYRLLGLSHQSGWRSYEGALTQAIDSFQPVSDRRLLEVSAPRLDIVTLPSAMTLREFADRYPSTADLATLALLNQVEGADSRLEAGARVKRVTGGRPPGAS